MTVKNGTGQEINFPFHGEMWVQTEMAVLDCHVCQKRYAIYEYVGDGAGDHTFSPNGVYSSKYCPYCGNLTNRAILEEER